MTEARIGTTSPATRPREGALAAGISVGLRGATVVRRRAVAASSGLRAVISPVGWALAGAALVGIVAGALLGWAELLGLGAAFAALVLVALLALIGRGATAVDLVLPLDRVAVGTTATVLLRSESAKRRLTGIRLEVPVGGRIVHRTLPRLLRGGRIDETLVLPTSRRGVVPIGPVRTVRGDPLGLVRREIVWSGEAVLHVHPRTASIPSLGAGFRHDLEGNATRDLTPEDVAFHSLREYQQGDDRRFIHWRSSAKTGRFMVQQFEETRRSRIAVVLDALPAGYADEEEFELAVSVVASLGIRAIRDGRTVDLWSSAPNPRARETRHPSPIPAISRERLLDALCLVEPDAAAADLPDAARAAAEAGSAVSLAFLVTGSGRAPGALRNAAGQFAPGVDVVVVECVPGVRPAVRALGGAVVCTIGYLEDLRRMIAQRAAA